MPFASITGKQEAAFLSGIRAGQYSLLLGAGFSMDSKNSNGNLPSGDQLSVAADVHVPCGRFDLTSEVVYVRNNTREAIDFSVAAWKAGIPVVIVPRAQVRFDAPPPVERAERDYYRYRWDVARGDESHDRVSRRWNIVELPDTYDFVREQKLRMSHWTWALIRARSLLRKLRDRLTGR